MENLASYLKNTRNKKFAIERNDAIFDIIPADEANKNNKNFSKIKAEVHLEEYEQRRLCV